MLLRSKWTNITTVDLLAVAKTVTIKKAAVIIEEVKTAVSNRAGYAAQTNVAERLWNGIAKEMMGVWWMLRFGWSDLIDGIWLMGFEQRLRETCT